MGKIYKWGIIGPGNIDNKFVEGLQILPKAELYAVASRSLENAEIFKTKYGFEKAFGSYEEMLKDPALDVVYIATTNNLHFNHTMMCLEAGKAVLCEKPFASNLLQVRQMVDKAREKQVFLMEALCSRLIPIMIQFKTQIENGIIGKPFLLQCDYRIYFPFRPLQAGL